MQPGLCGRCAHHQIVDTVRSRFYLCRLSFVDPRYRKYPVLPVLACPGYRPGSQADRGREAKHDNGGDE